MFYLAIPLASWSLFLMSLFRQDPVLLFMVWNDVIDCEYIRQNGQKNMWNMNKTITFPEYTLHPFSDLLLGLQQNIFSLMNLVFENKWHWVSSLWMVHRLVLSCRLEETLNIILSEHWPSSLWASMLINGILFLPLYLLSLPHLLIEVLLLFTVKRNIDRGYRKERKTACLS